MPTSFGSEYRSVTDPMSVPSPRAAWSAAQPVFVRTATTRDLPGMARLQVDELPLGLFPQLGPAFVARWHSAFLDSPHAVALVAVRFQSDGTENVVGFLVGSTDRRQFGRELLSRHRLGLAVRGCAALIARPALLCRFLRTRLLPYLHLLGRRRGDGRADGVFCDEVEERTGDLTAVAVAPAVRRRGVARSLADAYLSRCAAVGAAWVELVTAIDTSAELFYLGTGWTPLHRSRTRDGVVVQRYGRRSEGAR